MRRIAFDPEEETDDNGEFVIPNLGVDVPFVIDVHARNYVATSSEQLKITSGATELPKSILLADNGGTILVQFRDKQDNPVSGVQVIMLADPSSRPSGSSGSWLYAKSFHQVGRTSSLGNTRFDSVPTGKILVRAKFAEGVVEKRANVVSNQEISLNLTAP